MRGLLERLRWEAVLLHRNNLLLISIAITVIYVGLFQLLKLMGSVELVSIWMVLNDPAVIGVLFVGVTVIFEREQGTLSALRVAPLNLHHYLLAKIFLLSLLGTLCGLGMALGSVGIQFAPLSFALATFLVSVGFTHMGILIVTRTRRFIDFALQAGGLVILLSLPFLNLFGWVELPGMWCLPTWHAVQLLLDSYGLEAGCPLWMSYTYLILFNVLTYAWAFRRFQRISAI